MNKILLVLIVASGFLLIFYANNDILTRKKLFSLFQSDYGHNSGTNHPETNYTDIRRVKYIPKNTTEYNIFVIYTRETVVLKTKFELFLKSLLKYTSIPLHLHIVADERSELSVEDVLKKEINEYRRVVFYTLYNMADSAAKISDISKAMMPHFNSNPGKLFFFCCCSSGSKFFTAFFCVEHLYYTATIFNRICFHFNNNSTLSRFILQ